MEMEHPYGNGNGNGAPYMEMSWKMEHLNCQDVL